MARIFTYLGAVVVAGALGASAQQTNQTDGATPIAKPSSESVARYSPASNPQDTARRAREDERAEADLTAQKDMAKWALGVLIISAFGTALSLFGVVLIWRTLVHTRRSANSSDTMAAQSVEATKAALKSAAVAERALVGIERPFLVVEPALSGEVTQQGYTFVNHGRTPCVIVGSNVQYLPITQLNAPEALKPNMLQAALSPDWNVVPPNGGKTPVQFVPLGKPFVDGAERAHTWMLHGYAIYRSLTGDYFECGFGLYKKGWSAEWRALGPNYNYDERREPGVPRKPKRELTVVAYDKEGRPL